MSNIEELVKDVLLNDISVELVNRIAKALDINYHLTSTYELSVDVEDILSTDRNADPSNSGFYVKLEGTRSGVSFFYDNNLIIRRKPDSRKTRVVQRWNNLKGFSESFWHKWADKWLDSSNMNLEEGLMELTQKQAEKIVDAIKADDRHDPAQFQKLFDNKHLWFGEFDGDRCTALVSVRKDDLGLNDYYINEFQSFEKGAGKKLLNQLIDMYNTLWLMSDPEATDSLKDYYRQFGLNEFVLNNNIYNRPVSFFYNKGLDSGKFKKAVSYYYGNETYDHDPLIEKIIKKSDGYYVTSEDGKKNLGGPYGTEDEAKRRLQQVHYFKNKGKKKAKNESFEDWKKAYEHEKLSDDLKDKIVVKEFNIYMTSPYEEDVPGAVLVIPNGYMWSDGTTTDAVVEPVNEKGNGFNFNSVEEAQRWLDRWKKGAILTQDRNGLKLRQPEKHFNESYLSESPVYDDEDDTQSCRVEVGFLPNMGTEENVQQVVNTLAKFSDIKKSEYEVSKVDDDFFEINWEEPYEVDDIGYEYGDEKGVHYEIVQREPTTDFDALKELPFVDYLLFTYDDCKELKWERDSQTIDESFEEVGTIHDSRDNVYFVLRKTVRDGDSIKVLWKAAPQGSDYGPDLSRAFDITYKQAIGEEPLDSAQDMGKILGRKLGMNKSFDADYNKVESLNEDFGFGKQVKLYASKVENIVDNIVPKDEEFRDEVIHDLCNATWTIYERTKNGYRIVCEDEDYADDNYLGFEIEVPVDAIIVDESLNEDLSPELQEMKNRWEEIIADGRLNVLEFPADYKYIDIDWNNGTIFAGSATNTGIVKEFEMPLDTGENLDENIAELYDLIITQRPELLDPNFIDESKKLRENYDPQVLRDYINRYADSADDMAEIWEDVYNETFDEDLANDVIEGIEQIRDGADWNYWDEDVAFEMESLTEAKDEDFNKEEFKQNKLKKHTENVAKILMCKDYNAETGELNFGQNQETTNIRDDKRSWGIPYYFTTKLKDNGFKQVNSFRYEKNLIDKPTNTNFTVSVTLKTTSKDFYGKTYGKVEIKNIKKKSTTHESLTEAIDFNTIFNSSGFEQNVINKMSFLSNKIDGKVRRFIYEYIENNFDDLVFEIKDLETDGFSKKEIISVLADDVYEENPRLKYYANDIAEFIYRTVKYIVSNRQDESLKEAKVGTKYSNGTATLRVEEPDKNGKIQFSFLDKNGRPTETRSSSNDEAFNRMLRDNGYKKVSDESLTEARTNQLKEILKRLHDDLEAHQGEDMFDFEIELPEKYKDKVSDIMRDAEGIRDYSIQEVSEFVDENGKPYVYVYMYIYPGIDESLTEDLSYDEKEKVKNKIYRAIRKNWVTIFNDEWLNENNVYFDFNADTVNISFSPRKNPYYSVYGGDKYVSGVDDLKNDLKAIGLKGIKIKTKKVKPHWIDEPQLEVRLISANYRNLINKVDESLTEAKNIPDFYTWAKGQGYDPEEFGDEPDVEDYWRQQYDIQFNRNLKAKNYHIITKYTDGTIDNTDMGYFYEDAEDYVDELSKDPNVESIRLIFNRTGKLQNVYNRNTGWKKPLHSFILTDTDIDDTNESLTTGELSESIDYSGFDLDSFVDGGAHLEKVLRSYNVGSAPFTTKKWPDGKPVIKYFDRDPKYVDVKLVKGENVVVSNEYPVVYKKYKNGWVMIEFYDLEPGVLKAHDLYYDVDESLTEGKRRWEVGNRVRYEGRYYYVINYLRGAWELEDERTGERIRVFDESLTEDVGEVYTFDRKVEADDKLPDSGGYKVTLFDSIHNISFNLYWYKNINYMASSPDYINLNCNDSNLRGKLFDEISNFESDYNCWVELRKAITNCLPAGSKVKFKPIDIIQPKTLVRYSKNGYRYEYPNPHYKGSDMNESLTEGVKKSVEDKLLDLISVSKHFDNLDNIKIEYTPKGNLHVFEKGKDLLTLRKQNFNKSELKELEKLGYFKKK